MFYKLVWQVGILTTVRYTGHNCGFLQRKFIYGITALRIIALYLYAIIIKNKKIRGYVNASY